MAIATKPKKTDSTEKEFRKIISGKLDIALKEYRDVIGTKKFVSIIKKASKSFSYDLAKAVKREEKMAEKKAKKK